MKHDLKLHHYWRSSCSWRVRWALAIKKVPYTAIAVNLLKGEQQSPEYLKLNPLGFVPCLEVDGRPMNESLAILEWIEENYPEPRLLPVDSFQRAKVRELALLVISGIQPMQNLSVQRYYSVDEGKKKIDGQYWIKRGLASFEKLIEPVSGKYCVGDALTFADLCLVPQCYNAERFEVDLAFFPILNAIYRRARVLPECIESEPVNPDA